MASAFPGLPVSRGLLPGLPVSQARSARATAEVSTVGCGLLPSMKILTEKFRALTAVKRTSPASAKASASRANFQRDSPLLPNEAPGLFGVVSPCSLNAKVNPTLISFTGCPLTSA